MSLSGSSVRSGSGAGSSATASSAAVSWAGTSSRSGFSVTSCSRTSASSSVVSGSSLMACCSDGVRMSRCERRVWRPSFWWMATGQTPRGRAPAGSGLAAVEVETLAEVDAPDLGIRGQLLRRARAKHMTVPENIGPIRYFQGLAHVVVGDQDADAAAAEVGDDLLNVEDGEGIDTREWLVRGG